MLKPFIPMSVFNPPVNWQPCLNETVHYISVLGGIFSARFSSHTFTEVTAAFNPVWNEYIRPLYVALLFLEQINNSSQPLRLHCAIPTARPTSRRPKDPTSNLFSIQIIVLALRRSFSSGIFEELMSWCLFSGVSRVIKAG